MVEHDSKFEEYYQKKWKEDHKDDPYDLDNDFEEHDYKENDNW